MNPAKLIGSRLIKPGDVLTLAGGLLLVGGLFFYTWAQPAGTYLVVNAQGKMALRARLDQDRQFDIAGKLGVTRIQIRQGRVRVQADPGPRQICVKQGWIQRAGETALCLANEVSLEIQGTIKPYDSVNY